MVVISDIDDDPLIHRHLPSRGLRGELIMCCHCCAVHCRVSAQKVITMGSPGLSCRSLLTRGLARQGGSRSCSCSKNTSNHHASRRLPTLKLSRRSETRYVQRLTYLQTMRDATMVEGEQNPASDRLRNLHAGRPWSISL